VKHEKAARVRRSRIISWLEFIEAPVFTRLLPKYLTDDEYRELQLHLARSPDAGDVLQGTGGFRKVRWTDRRRGQGKRGGLRVIYYYFEAEMQIWLLTVYDKDEAVDLTPGERRSLKEAMAEEKRQRAARRTRRRN
jgi:hypothetical protein